MNFILSKISLRSFFLSVLLCTTLVGNVFAAANQESFEHWLEKYGAWDILENNYSSAEDSPELILKRAETAFKLGRFSSCLGILQSTPAFNDKKQEITRLWLGARTHRAQGDPVKAVIWYSQAARLMTSQNLAARFTDEPYLKQLWFDVLRSLYWGYFVTPESAREARRMVLEQAFNQAALVWPKTYFVVNSRQNLAVLNSTAPVNPEKDNSTALTDNDRIHIVKALASASLGEWDKSDANLNGIGNSTVRTFWKTINGILGAGKYPENVSEYEQKGLIHAAAFFKAGVLEPLTGSPALWQLAAPSSPAWSVFRKKLLEMQPEDALETIDRETGSLLLSSDLVSALQNYKLAFALLTGNLKQAKKVWKKLDNDTLPLSLRIAAAVAFKPPFSKVLNSSDLRHNEHLFIISNLCDAAGINYYKDITRSFWTPLHGEKLNGSINRSPMDRLLVFTELMLAADHKMDKSTARRCGFLFPESELAARSFIFLAEDAAGIRDYNLSAFYLKKVNQDKFGADIRLKWLGAAVEYDLAVGNDAKALNAYNEILESGGILSPQKELKLALMIQQKGELKKAQDILERIWENRKDLNAELKAEILFWIAEGEHAMGDKEKALKHYLELAWEFPEQNIWAVTAMYRSSMIYEHKGQFETAKRFLETVIKRADRKAQKEAAQSRLNAIDGKLAKIGIDKETSFPF